MSKVDLSKASIRELMLVTASGASWPAITFMSLGSWGTVAAIYIGSAL